MEGYLTTKEIAKKWGISVRTVQSFCIAGKIKGASKMSNIWIIPEDAEMPKDGRLKNRNYVGWRKSEPKQIDDEGGLDGRF